MFMACSVLILFDNLSILHWSKQLNHLKQLNQLNLIFTHIDFLVLHITVEQNNIGSCNLDQNICFKIISVFFILFHD